MTTSIGNSSILMIQYLHITTLKDEKQLSFHWSLYTIIDTKI